MKQLWFTDPDGYGLCFQWPATQETYNSWVAAKLTCRIPGEQILRLNNRRVDFK